MNQFINYLYNDIIKSFQQFINSFFNKNVM